MYVEHNYFFKNPYAEYSPEFAANLIENGKITPNYKLVTGFIKQWENALRQFRKLDRSDCSVYTGTAGIALLKLRKCGSDVTGLTEVRDLLKTANTARKKRVSFLCGDAGPLAILAVVCYRLKEKEQCAQAIEGIRSMAEEVLDIYSDLPNEYLYGRAGYLYAILYVNKNCTPKPFDDYFIRQIIEAILATGKRGADFCDMNTPLMYQWHSSYYLGAAHGLAGIIYLLLQVKELLTEDELNKLILPTIEYLATLRFPSGNYPSSVGRDKDTKMQWCHGAPGFVFLYCAAFKVYGDSKFLQLALDAGEVVWKRGLLKKGYSLCHGVAGNTYCFLELYNTTKDEEHLYRAIRFADWVYEYNPAYQEREPDRPLSLYEGLAGRLYLLLDIQEPSEARFPGFSL